MPRRTIVYTRLDQLAPALRNPKRHDQPGLTASFDRLGMVEVITEDDRTGRLISGHGRVDQLRQRYEAGQPPPDGIDTDDDGMWLAPVVKGWASADDGEAEAAVVAVNELVTRGGWEPQDLAAVLDSLTHTEQGLAGTGYTEPDLAALLQSLEQIDVAAHTRSQADEAPAAIPADPVTQPGDVWLLGPHRVMCGSSRDAAHVARILGADRIAVAVTSPPYADRREYDEASGFRPIPPDDYVEWFAPVAANVATHLADDGSWFVNIKPGATPDSLDTELYVIDLVLAHVRQWGWHFATEFCWERGGMPKRVLARFKNQWEPVYQFARGRWKIRPHNVMHHSSAAIELTGPGVGSTSWADPGSNFTTQGEAGGDWFRGRIVDGMAFPGNRLPTFTGSHEATGHTAAFPVGLPAWFVKAYSDPGDVIYDPFLGSGSTVIAADQEGRLGRGMEISPGYCDVAVARIQRHTGHVPVLESTGQPHDFAQEPARA